ncbi:RNA polymerase sigma factor [Streptomyces antibioticus]|uniref:RNA polymerase sigma factor n=1 Tax=Streptomyces antibioticus TaxID=1890 RepID=UPI0036F74D09
MSEMSAPADQQRGEIPQPSRDKLSLLPEERLRNDFDAFYVAEKRYVIRFLLWAGARPWEAEDIAHEALMRLLPERWSTIEHPRAWLRKVTCRSWWRQHERNREDTADALPDLPGGISPVTEIELSEQAQRVLHAVKQLPAMQRAVMAFLLDGADTSEIAGALNMSEDAVRANASRARHRLKEILRFERGESNA